MKRLFFLLLTFLFCSAGNAAELQKIDFMGQKVVLTGEKLANGFCRDFLFHIEGDAAPYMLNPDVAGGYYPELKIVKLRENEEQLFLSVRQGGQNATSEYRIFAMKNNKLKPIFEATESAGMISSVNLDGEKMQVVLLDGVKQDIELDKKIWEKIDNDFLRGYEPNFVGFHNLMPYDKEGDGIDELYATQRIEMAGQELGYVAVRMDLQKDDSWKMSHYVLQLPTIADKNTEAINRGVTTSFYEIHSEKIYIEEAQGAIPKFYCQNENVSEKVNKNFKEFYIKNLKQLFGNNESMGYEIIIAHDNILSVRFIGSDAKKNNFLHIEPSTGRVMTIEDMFTISKDFLKTMTILSPTRYKYKKKDLGNWFIKGVKLNVILDEDGKQRAETFSLSAFEQFLSPNNHILEKKVD